MEKKLVLHDTHTELGAKMVNFSSYLMPVRYTSEIEEHHAVRKNAGLFDVSHMGEFWIEGNGALNFLQYLTINDLNKINENQVQYNCLVNENGGVIDDLLIYKFNKNKFLLVVNAARIERDWEYLNLTKPDDVKIENASENLCLLALQGPKSNTILSEWYGKDLSRLKYYEFIELPFLKNEQIIISATGYTGERGFEIFLSNNLVKKTWYDLLEIGKKYGLKPAGLGARDTLRLEMGYCLYGNELNENTTPIESGLGCFVSTNKHYIALDLLQKQKKMGTTKKLIPFEMLEKSIPRKDYEVFDDKGQKIGTVTSGTLSPTLNKGIGLAYIYSSKSNYFEKILIKIRDKLVPAQFTKVPFVKNTSLKNYKNTNQ
jgi:aminomethyltransferase